VTISISDLDDPRIDVFRDVRDRDLRGRKGVFMAESEMVVRRLLRSPERLHSVLLSPAKAARMAGELRHLPDDVTVYVAELPLMEAIAGFHIHRGVLAAGWRPHEQDLAFDRMLDRLEPDGTWTVLAAQGINNADNMGGLFRTAAALGVNEVLLERGCCDPLYRKAIRVSMGHVLSVPWCVAEDLCEAIGVLQVKGFRITAAESCQRSTRLGEAVPAARRVVVVGAEGEGLDARVLDACDDVVEIPMAAGVPSLNVVVAAGIVLERLRPPTA
jgi:tRNA G18 (ribose-2'-O)-methylase SpoU